MTETREDEVALNRAKHCGRTPRPQAPASPRPPGIPRITRLMSLAIKFQDMIDRGEVKDYADLARLGLVTRARLTQIMNLTLLAPEIQEQILSGLSAHERSLRRVACCPDWASQRRIWSRAILKAASRS